MRKCLLFVTLLLVSQYNIALAQRLFDGPDTVCINQPVQLASLAKDVQTHYWGFCSGYLLNAAGGDNLGKEGYDLDGPSDIDIVKEGDNYYGFVVTAATNEFKRLEFGKSLANTPKVTNYGNFNNALPQGGINSLFIVRDSVDKKWFIFLTAGNTVANSEMARIDYPKSLADTPNIVNFGNVGNVLDGPYGLFVAKEANKWYGFLLNKTINTLVRVDFDTNISITPALTDLGPGNGFFSNPHDLCAVRDNGLWYFFITNEANSSLLRMDVGASLNVTTYPLGGKLFSNTAVTELDGKFANPNGITYIRDCDSQYLFVTQRASHELVRIGLSDISDLSLQVTNFGNVAGMETPSGLSKMMRDRDDLYMFATNFTDSSISRIKFAQCVNASITSSITNPPPAYTYNAPGVYNIYYAVNEGLPNMEVECKQISVLPLPAMFISNDTTICEGDTVTLMALSLTSLSVTWSPNYNISSTKDITIKAWPEYQTQYKILLPYANGCIVDTGIYVNVNKIKADAGPDRMVADGSNTLVGGPLTSVGGQYAYNWHPAQYIDNPMMPNAVVRPPYDFTYYLEVSDTKGCKAVDTVVVHVGCQEINMPNAFVPDGPNSSSMNARFGLLNKGIVKLNFFRIFDRWGKEVFTTTDPTKQWDGTVNGKLAPLGVYVWEADGFCVSGQKIQKSGNVTLIR